MKNLFSFLLLITNLCAFSQGETNIWYFGINAGLDFNSGKPKALTNGKLKTDEGCATISTNKGRLLFYTDGVTIWDSTHNIMPNGTNLKGNTSSTQSALIVPIPDSNHLFYIFTMDAIRTGSDGCTYSQLNMKLNSMKGDINAGKKNIAFFSFQSEKITGIKHGNGKDYWIILTKGGDSLFSWQITPTGILPPVKSKTTFANPLGGYLKISPNGKKIVSVSYKDSSTIGDFNNLTGKITNTFNFYNPQAYGIEFSPGSNFLYATGYNKKIYQFNINAASKQKFMASKIMIDSLFSTYIGALQLASDGKIYISCYYNKYLHTILNPDSLGLKCQLKRDYVFLEDKISQAGLPNFVQSYFQKTTFTVSQKCLNNSSAFFISNGDHLDSVKWDFGDSAAGNDNFSNKTIDVNHVYKNNGNYMVRLITFNNNHVDTIKLTITYQKQRVDFSVSDICETDSVKFINKSIDGKSFLWKFGDGKTSSLEWPYHVYKIDGITQTFNVTLVAKVDGGCADSIVKAVTINANPKSNFTYIFSNNKWSFTPIQTGNTKSRWLFGDGDSSIAADVNHTYKDGLSNHTVCLKTTNAAGCVSETCKQIETTSISYSRPSGFTIYPNPNTGNFTVEIDNPENDISIEVFNSVGELVKKVEMVEKVITINLYVSSGIYLVKVRNGEMIYSQKMSIEK